MNPVIVRKIARADTQVIAKLGEAGVATIHEAMNRSGLMRPYMRPLYPGAKVAGSAVTILSHPGDNLMIHAAIDVCQPGDVLVVALASDSTDGMFGELLAVSCQARGITGLVIDAGVRDSEVIAQMNFPVWSKAISAQGTVKATPGSVNIPVVCAGALVRPGDIIVGDGDGVVVVPREEAEAVASRAEQRMQREDAVRERLRKGELGMDIYGFRQKLEQMGVRYVGE
ncbi:MAG: 4-carboxy-4-hydroxy-2-oxoadipate aldolase/oxaloacetate decarboxylase [Alicyclobacillus sp.]|nr:4-carboxy-4-hydroxy-2-oxoadipate aldolase/oxaloacetate decarboxylase [Alicyclobacillus sp.]